MNNADEEVLIWLRSIGSNVRDEKILRDNVEKFVNDIRIYDDVNECIAELSSVCEEKIFLRLGSGLSHLINILDDFNQVQYIYLSEPSEYKSSVKVRGVFNDNIQLFDQLQKDINAWKNHHVYLTLCDVDSRRMETTTQDVQNHAARFMWSQMLLKTLLQMPSPSNNINKDLLEEARPLYANNERVLAVIEKFEREYQADHAIKRCTCDSFLYRLINKALRTRGICLIFKFRYLIQHIRKQLKDQQQQILAGWCFSDTNQLEQHFK
ncbi:unnamed protein product [Rotaria sp. Silwood2]|nr:unnamed protein product [Rotaria sp. Silwood2]